MPAPAESALNNVRAEWVASSFTSDGIPEVPTDPSWNRFSDYIQAYSWAGDPNVEGQTPTGQGDMDDHFRGPEEHDGTVQWWMQRHPVDGSNNPHDPWGELIEADWVSQWPSHEVIIRREVTDGGVDGAGLRDFIYWSGARPISASAPGDPSASSPILVEGNYAIEKGRQYVVHQPADGTTLDIVSTDSNDTMDITIENEDASESETISLSGTTTVTTSQSFTGIDAFWLASEPAGDITIKDDGGNDLLEDPITGSNSDGVAGDRGIPPLGTGSHASAIGTDAANYLFLGTSSTYAGGALAPSADADRVHALDLTIEAEVSREPRQGTRRQSLDVGGRTVSIEADLAGPYETAKQNHRYFTSDTGDIVYTYPDGDVTVKNAQLTDTDDVDFEGGDENIIYGVTFEGHGDPAVTATNT